jgi:uncharacterized protein DUF6916
MDRREFLKGSTAAVVAIGLSPWLIAGTSATGAGTLSQADYEALRNSWFHVGSPEEGWQTLELVNVRDDGSNARAEQWSVFFRGDPGTELSEGLHTLVPPDGSELDLFLQPAGEDGSSPLFAARFNRLRIVPASCAPA